ncbi:hypothetical protein ACFE04_006197 [Oxalis oulophora]
MAKFNVVQKRRRAAISEMKRATKGDPGSRKLKVKPQLQSVSGKRQRKILKKWRRDQKEALDKGLVTMEDVEMAAADSQPKAASTSKAPAKFHMKKGLKIKQSKCKGKDKKKSETSAKSSGDAMVE